MTGKKCCICLKTPRWGYALCKTCDRAFSKTLGGDADWHAHAIEWAAHRARSIERRRTGRRPPR